MTVGEPRLEESRVCEPRQVLAPSPEELSQPLSHNRPSDDAGAAKKVKRSGALKRHRERTRQLQRGFGWFAGKQSH